MKSISRPVIDRLPVGQLDDFACRQLDRVRDLSPRSCSFALSPTCVRPRASFFAICLPSSRCGEVIWRCGDALQAARGRGRSHRLQTLSFRSVRLWTA